MGKSLATIEHTDSSGTPSRIRRSELIDAVDKAVTATELRYPGDPGLDIVRTARQLARTTSTIDACTWRNKGSCGCPMTAVGAVTLRADAEDGDAQGPAGYFAEVYDDEIQRRLESSATALILTVVDD